MPQLLFTVWVLVVVILGMLVMTQVVRLEQVSSAFWKAFQCLVLASVALWTLKFAVLPILLSALVWSKGVMKWSLAITGSVVALLILLRLLFMGLAKHKARDKHKKENMS